MLNLLASQMQWNYVWLSAYMQSECWKFIIGLALHMNNKNSYLLNRYFEQIFFFFYPFCFCCFSLCSMRKVEKQNWLFIVKGIVILCINNVILLFYQNKLTLPIRSHTNTGTQTHTLKCVLSIFVSLFLLIFFFFLFLVALSQLQAFVYDSHPKKRQTMCQLSQKKKKIEKKKNVHMKKRGAEWKRGREWDRNNGKYSNICEQILIW